MLFLGWSVATVLIAYWLENGVVGLINVPRIVIAGREARNSSLLWSVVVATFFLLHYGLFWLVHGVFVFALTSISVAGASPAPVDRQGIAITVLLLFLSHGVSFIVNYIGRGEYLHTTPAVEARQPYGRLVVLHLTILVGAFAVILLGQPVVLIALLVLFKTVADLGLHVRARRLEWDLAKAD